MSPRSDPKVRHHGSDTHAQLDTQLPCGQLWRYEPKLDGFRGLLWPRAGSQVQLMSRNSRDLGPWFPELMRAPQLLPPNTLVDGEIVICNETGGLTSAGYRTALARRATAWRIPPKDTQRC